MDRPRTAVARERVQPDVAAHYTLTTWCWIPRPRDEVFAFFADAHNLERLTPAFLKFRVRAEGPIPMHAGALIHYRLRLRGMPLAWTSEITDWEPPERFQDVQRRGPYAEWVHTHEFEEQDEGTLVRDTVRYRLRGPRVLSRLVNRLLVAPDTTRIFRFRHFALEAAFGVQGRARAGPVVITPAG